MRFVTKYGNVSLRFGNCTTSQERHCYYSTISLKHVTIEGKLIWRTYRNSPMLSPTVPSPTLYGFFFPKIGGSQPPPTNPMAIISGMGEDTDFKFGWNIHGVHPNKSPLNILEKGERGRIQELPKFFGYPQLSQERVKATVFKFGRNIHNFTGSI